ncbi:MAG: transporter [Acidobacteria bacterium]|nr:transporter [Acidobacteriota bacterium]
MPQSQSTGVAAAGRAKSLTLVFGCTVLGAAAQILFKFGLKLMPQVSPLAVLTNLPLMAGLTLYGASTLLLVLALREGELSLLYPVISLTYAWVAVLSVVWLGEQMDALKAAGIVVIIAGVALLGRSRKF